ncbi:MAG: class IIb bacteriocin, lactobin A/cerein 7B family [Bacilli bacterium]|nr:class IIb bacteriocin, lactobin A/cerein 7B family [Bacilli bacterium]
MVKLKEEEMKNINAGGITAVGWAVIAAGLSFLAGLLDGYTRPYKCR